LRKRNLIDFIEKQNNRITKVADENLAENIDLYTIRWQIEDHTDRYQEVLLYPKKTAPNNIANAAETLDALFLVNKLRYMCIAENHNTVSTSPKIELTGTDVVLKWILDNPDNLQKYPLLNAYYLLWQMLKNRENTTFFHAAHDFITQNEQHFASLELDTLYSLLSNRAIALTNAGQKEFTEIAMNLNKNGLERGYFHRNNATIIKNYLNVVKLSIQCGKTDEIHTWLAALEKHEHKISESVHTHCVACLDFHKKDYKQVIESIRGLSFADELDKLGNHALLLRAYFCAEETPDLAEFISSRYYTGFTEHTTPVRAALKAAKGKISDTHWLQYSNFVDVLVAIKAHNTQNPAQRENNRRHIVEKINNTTPIIYKAWLQEQVK
jgi:hypothetical protein